MNYWKFGNGADDKISETEELDLTKIRCTSLAY